MKVRGSPHQWLCLFLILQYNVFLSDRRWWHMDKFLSCPWTAGKLRHTSLLKLTDRHMDPTLSKWKNKTIFTKPLSQRFFKFPYPVILPYNIILYKAPSPRQNVQTCPIQRVLQINTLPLLSFSKKELITALTLQNRRRLYRKLAQSKRIHQPNVIAERKNATWASICWTVTENNSNSEVNCKV